MEGEITQNIWRNLKEGVKRCVIKKQVKIRRRKIGDKV